MFICLIFVLNTLVLLYLRTEVGKQLHKKGDEYAYDFLNSSDFGLGTFRFLFIAFLTAYGLDWLLKHMKVCYLGMMEPLFFNTFKISRAPDR